MLHGRRTECAELDRLLEALPSGHSAILVLRGEAGIGKTALLEYTAERAEGCRVVRAVGVESEMELPFAGLHQLCAPLLVGLERLPPPQRDALGIAFDLTSGPRVAIDVVRAAGEPLKVGSSLLGPAGRGPKPAHVSEGGHWRATGARSWCLPLASSAAVGRVTRPTAQRGPRWAFVASAAES
jgi:hypothetical protein